MDNNNDNAHKKGGRYFYKKKIRTLCLERIGECAILSARFLDAGGYT